MPLFKVETVSQFRMVYFIEAKSSEHAMDEVIMREALEGNEFFDEAAQEHIGEQIICADEVTYDQFNSWINNNKKISSHWMGDKLIHRINYDKDKVDCKDTEVGFAENDEEHTSRQVFRDMGTSLIMGRPEVDHD